MNSFTKHNKLFLGTILVSILFLAGCPTAYEAMTMTGGYHEKYLGKNVYRVVFA